MRIKEIRFVLLAITLVVSSCTKSNDPSIEIEGMWEGTIVQPEFGELITTLNINNTNLNASSGSGSFTSGDIAVCDNTQFNCVPLACTFNLSFLSSSGSSFYEVDQILIENNTTCGDGIFEITIKDQNSLNVTWYEESFPDNRASGVLLRK